jgi:hypothetical protein
MGVFSHAIGVLGGRELGGEGVWIGKTGGLKGAEISVGIVVATVIGGGVLKPGVGKSPKFLGLDQVIV